MISTEQLAEKIGVKPTTIRTQLCREGNYFGIKPKKLPNNRLAWSDECVLKLIDKFGVEGDAPSSSDEFLSTEQVANLFMVKAPSIRTQFCKRGNYMGIVPVKTKGRFLRWRKSDVEKVLNGDV